MKKLVSTLILVFALAIVASAQVNLQVSGFAVTNNPAGTQEFGYGLGGGYRYEKLYLGLDVFSDPSKTNPKQPARGRAFATWDLYDWNGLKLSAGGGGWKTGNETGGFGHVGVQFRRFSAIGRYGNQQFAEAEGAFEAIKAERFAVGPFYRYTRTGNFQTLQQAGLRLTLR